MSAAHFLSRWFIARLSRFAPAHARARWREEWLGELEHAAGSLRGRFRATRLILMTLGAIRDVVALRRAARLRITGPRPGVFSGLANDFRDACRSIVAAPGVALGVIGSLALGMVAVTAGFSVVNTTLLKSPGGIVRPGDLVEVRVQWMFGSAFQLAATYDTFPAFRGAIPSLVDVAARRQADLIVGLPDGADSVPAAVVSGNYFELLGVKPALGRLIAESDDERPGAHPVMVIAYETWLRHYGGDEGVLGRIVRVNGRPLEIIGVAEHGFTGTRVAMDQGTGAYAWVPFAMGELVARDAGGAPVDPARLTNFHVELIGRLRPGATARATQAEAAVVAARIQLPGTDARRLQRVTVTGLSEAQDRVDQRFLRSRWMRASASFSSEETAPIPNTPPEAAAMLSQ